MDQQAAKDFDRFTAASPEDMEKEKKARAAAEKSKKTATKKVTPAQMEAAAKLSEKAKDDSEAAEKVRLFDLLGDYKRILAEYYPNRIEFVQVPKNIPSTAALSDLKLYVKMYEREFGKKSGMGIAVNLLSQGAGALEKFTANERFGLNLRGLQMGVSYELQPKENQDGEMVPSELAALLAELTAKHGNLFNSRVEIRFAMAIMNIVVNVHRVNTEAKIAMNKASKPVSEVTAAAMNNL